jgi:hypothetical protein
MKNVFKTLVASSLLVGIVNCANAAVVQVADFTSHGFNFTYSGGANATLTGSAAANFEFDDLLGGAINGYNPVIGAYLTATLTVTANFSLPSSNLADNPIDSLTMSFIGASPGFVGADLLTITTGYATAGPGPAGQGGNLNAVGVPGPTTPDNGSTSSSILASNDGTTSTQAPYVEYTSNVINTLEGHGLSDENVALALTANLGAEYKASGPFAAFLDATKYTIAGNLAANTPVPEPGSVALAMGAVVSLSALRLRRRRK